MSHNQRAARRNKTHLKEKYYQKKSPVSNEVEEKAENKSRTSVSEVEEEKKQKTTQENPFK